jgi:hypothetical protein
MKPVYIRIQAAKCPDGAEYNAQQLNVKQVRGYEAVCAGAQTKTTGAL